MYRLVPSTIRVDKKSIAESTVLAMSDIEGDTSTIAIFAPRRRIFTIVLRLIAQRIVARASSALSACFCAGRKSRTSREPTGLLCRTRWTRLEKDGLDARQTRTG